jgi:hypothetical protein
MYSVQGSGGLNVQRASVWWAECTAWKGLGYLGSLVALVHGDGLGSKGKKHNALRKNDVALGHAYHRDSLTGKKIGKEKVRWDW